jgi:hypothetical protein
MKRVAVVVPVRPSAYDTVRVLVADGPPFDLRHSGIDRHEVFVTEHEAVFVFEGANPREAVEQLLADPGVWRAAAAWRDCVRGRPRIADVGFAWEREPVPLHVPGL